MRVTRLVVALAAASCSSAPQQPPAIPAHPVAPAATATDMWQWTEDVSKFDQLNDLFGTHVEPHLNEKGQARYAAFIKDLFESDAFYEGLTNILLPFTTRVDNSYVPVYWILKTGQAEGKSYYYIDGMCPKPELVSVTPWWDTTTKVWICKESYRVDVKDETHPIFGYKTCDSAKPRFMPETKCGCGPNLVYCAKDKDQSVALTKAAKAEVNDTLKYIIKNHLPFSSIFTLPGSVRTGYGDFFYARSHLFNTGELKMLPVDAPAELRDRDAPSAGWIGAPWIMYTDVAIRHVTSALWSDLFCIGLTNAQVHASVLLSSVKNHPEETRWGVQRELMTIPGCENCHAKLESIMMSWPVLPLALGARLRPASTAPAETISLMMIDQDDRRATGPADWRWLTSAMAKQPEFQKCMVSRVRDTIYEGMPVTDAVQHRLEAAFEKQDFAALLEAAIASRFGDD